MCPGIPTDGAAPGKTRFLHTSERQPKSALSRGRDVQRVQKHPKPKELMHGNLPCAAVVPITADDFFPFDDDWRNI